MVCDLGYPASWVREIGQFKSGDDGRGPLGPSAVSHSGPIPADPRVGYRGVRRSPGERSEGRLMVARRSRGDGGLSWDDSRKRWIASLTVGYTPAGKRIVKRGSGRTKTEAQRKLREIIRDYEDGQVTDGHNYTVAQAVRDWLQFGLSGRDEDTIVKCTILANTHVIPALGARKPRELSADDVDRWLADKAKTLSTRTLYPHTP